MEGTIKCPIYDKKLGHWIIPENGFKNRMRENCPSMQIHYNGHWLLSVKTEGNFFIVDSIRGSRHSLTSATEILVCQIYCQSQVDSYFYVFMYKLLQSSFTVKLQRMWSLRNSK